METKNKTDFLQLIADALYKFYGEEDKDPKRIICNNIDIEDIKAQIILKGGIVKHDSPAMYDGLEIISTSAILRGCIKVE